MSSPGPSPVSSCQSRGVSTSPASGDAESCTDLLTAEIYCVQAVKEPSGERQDFLTPKFFIATAPTCLENSVRDLIRQKMDDIEDRLRSHAQAFDGLLSLIPAKYYYADENSSDQWKRKKQTKEQAREAKRAKLDPESAKTAKDIMDEQARKRKREDGSLESDSSDGELGSEVPGEGLKRGEKIKKQKQTEADASKPKSEEAEARKKAKEERKEKKKAAQKEKKKVKESAKKDKQQQVEKPSTTAEEQPKLNEDKVVEKPTSAGDDNEAENDEDDVEDGVAEEGFSVEFHEEPEEPSSASSARNSPNTSVPQSATSSISSIVPPSTSTGADATPAETKALKATPEELKQRLQKRLDELRAKRHADGFNGKPARNRQELIDSRRQKAEQRKAHKKELRQKAKEEEQRQKDEAMARRFSPGGSGSLLASPRSPAESVGSANNFSFGQVMFADGQIADHSLTGVRDTHKTRGPRDNDAAAQLKLAEAKKARLAEMDPEKRAELEEKDAWLNAKKRAHGERVRDDTSLLKKALKRKETAKKRSERDWKERIDTVSRMKEQRQNKREENLRKRREEKGTKGKGKSKKPSGGAKKKARPGFEGSFKAKVGGKK
ncbi:Uncharacterized protein PECH_005070 [Penicillium ucsense]|uniref:Ribosomal RNA-processing protein 14/surfeit locus protein 6 C-terminal domain-containing protein n=1 Tax=Penicillium ucsense TaxID=2839758 RepID=A0A8J8VY46_9EURO|nr:Uncharacterized protein PECM_002536 [Penicillium ucsense]KAF7736706.1 Uncharacterized protein PECH_005070 [Penicillium ucsense]